MIIYTVINIDCLLCATHCAKGSIFIVTLPEEYYYFIHLANENTEAQRSYIMCPLLYDSDVTAEMQGEKV